MDRDQHLIGKNENEVREEARTVRFVVVGAIINNVGCVASHVGLENRASLLEE